jgi:TolB protein
MRGTAAGWIAVSLFVQLGARTAVGAPPPDRVGIFEAETDVGSVYPGGTAAYDAASGRYVLRAAGANTWYHVDAFHYLWIKTEGDWALSADVAFPPQAYRHEPNPHRKGILMFRQSLDAGSAYAALAVHGSGLTALQYRRDRGANTQGIELEIELPKTIRIEKHGDLFTAYASLHGEPPHPIGASTRLRLKSPYYLGLGALSHDVDTIDEVQFSHVAMQRPGTAHGARAELHSTIQAIQIEDQFRRAVIVRSAPAFLESVNWIAGGKALLVDADGRLERIAYPGARAGAPPEPIAVGGLAGCSGNYGLSPDGKWLAVSCGESAGREHQIYLLAGEGGAAPRQVTHAAQSSYFHAWSADGQIIAFTRGSASKADIFTIAASGGAETQLTRDARNDGPSFSPNGEFIYFDSSRSGTSQIWRMHTDGSAAEQLTDDDNRNTSPHVSPDGKYLAFLSQRADAGEEIGNAALKIMDFHDGLIRTLVEFQGNRGSFALDSWGDENHLAFVSYERLP